MMQSNKREYDQINLSMIQNIAVPSVFSIKQIRSFYGDPQNELFRFPVPSYYQALQQQNQSPYNRSSSILSNLSPNYRRSVSSVNEYRSSQYQIPLKSESPTTSDPSSRGSPLRRMFPFLTPPSTKRSASISIQRSTTMSVTESRSLPKNLDELVLPPTFFNDDNVDHRTSSKSPKSTTSPKASKSMKFKDPKYTAVRTASIAVRESGKITKLSNSDNPNRIANRNRSRSLDAEHVAIEHRLSAHSRLIHGVLTVNLLIFTFYRSPFKLWSCSVLIWWCIITKWLDRAPYWTRNMRRVTVHCVVCIACCKVPGYSVTLWNGIIPEKER